MAALEVPAQVSEHAPAAPAVRSVRRATARRASARRAAARRRQRDSEATIIGFLVAHPRSTVGDLARSLNLDPEHVAACVAQLASAGEIQKGSHGYCTVSSARPKARGGTDDRHDARLPSPTDPAEKRSGAGGVIRAGG
jgi:hypothetical protein